jgi:hypothetical protein
VKEGFHGWSGCGGLVLLWLGRIVIAMGFRLPTEAAK